MSGINDIILGGQQNKNNKEITQSIYYGQVIDIDDSLDGLRIKVYIPGIDAGIDQSQLPYVMSLLPKMFLCVPKKGESVVVLLGDIKKPYSMRYWIGPFISEYQKIGFDSFQSATSITDQALIKSGKGINTIPSANGVFPVNPDNINYLSIIGRNNSDLQFTDNTLILRAGYHQTTGITTLNTFNPSYLRLSLLKDDSQSSASIVADQINLISHKGEKITKVIIGDEDVLNMSEKGYSLLRAELTIEFMKKFLSLFQNHVHKHTHEPPTDSEALKELLNFDFDKILNKYIKIN